MGTNLLQDPLWEMQGKVLVSVFTWERKHTDPFVHCLLLHQQRLLTSWLLQSVLCVDGNSPPPPLISEHPRAGATGLAAPSGACRKMRLKAGWLYVTKATRNVGIAGCWVNSIEATPPLSQGHRRSTGCMGGEEAAERP